MRNLRTNFLYYLTATIALFGVAAICISFFTSLSPAADIASRTPIEFDLTSLEEGEHARLNIYGSLVYIRHRSPKDINAVRASYHSALYPIRDEDRLLAYKGRKDPRFIILNGKNGFCVANPNMGNFKDQGGFSCPMRGSHFDGSGRIQKGPDSNLDVPHNARLTAPTIVQFVKS